MTRLLLRRLASFAVTLAVASALIFAVMEVLPGDPASVMLGLEARPDTVAALRHELGLDAPAAWRYLAWLGGMAAGDLGTSYGYRVPVATLVGERLAVTLPLALAAMLLSTTLALALAVLAVARRGRLADRAVLAFAELGVALPSFWVGILLILLFALRLGWLPAGSFPGWSSPLAALAALTLPTVALALPQAAVLTRLARGALLDVSREDFMRTARAKGLAPDEALWRHALPNALAPIAVIVGLQLPFLIGGAILVENVFALPGVGRLLVQAVAQRDLITVKSVAMLFAALVLLVNLAVDLLQAAVDPRVAEEP